MVKFDEKIEDLPRPTIIKPSRGRSPPQKKSFVEIITLLESLERRLSMLKMNGKTGLLYELHVIIDKLKEWSK